MEEMEVNIVNWLNNVNEGRKGKERYGEREKGRRRKEKEGEGGRVWIERREKGSEHC